MNATLEELREIITGRVATKWAQQYAAALYATSREARDRGDLFMSAVFQTDAG